MTKIEAKVLLVMLFASGPKKLVLVGYDLNQYMESSLEKMCSD